MKVRRRENAGRKFVNHAWAHDPDTTRPSCVAAIGADEYSGALTARWIFRSTRRRANTKRALMAQTWLRTSWASSAGNSRKTASSRTTLSLMDSWSGWTRPRASNPSRSATPYGTWWRSEQSIERVLKKYPDFPRNEVEEFLLDWIDMGYDPENYSQAQLDELDSLTERWVADHLQKAKASKKHTRELVTLEKDSWNAIFAKKKKR